MKNQLHMMMKNIHLGRSVTLTLKRLEVKQKAQAKIRIQQLLYDIEFSMIITKNDNMMILCTIKIIILWIIDQVRLM